jgi:hypothetical protein
MTSHTVSDRDPLTLDEMLAFLKRHAVKLVASTVACAAFGVGLSYVFPQEWEATVLIQAGQAQPASSAYHPPPGPILLEVPPRIVERLKADAFVDALLTKLGLPVQAGISRRTDLVRNSFNARVLRTSDLVEIKLRDFSRHDALRTLQLAQDQLIQAHAGLLQPTLARYKLDHDFVSHQLAEAQRRLEQGRKLNDAAKGAGSKSSAFAENVLLTNVLHETETEVGKLQLQLSELNEQMDPTRTFNTRAFSEATVSQRPVFPKRSAFLLAGAIIGFVAIFLVALFLERRRTQVA